MSTKTQKTIDKLLELDQMRTQGEWNLNISQDTRPWSFSANGRSLDFEFPIYGYDKENEWMVEENKNNAKFIKYAADHAATLARQLQEAIEVLRGISEIQNTEWPDRIHAAIYAAKSGLSKIETLSKGEV